MEAGPKVGSSLMERLLFWHGKRPLQSTGLPAAPYHPSATPCRRSARTPSGWRWRVGHASQGEQWDALSSSSQIERDEDRSNCLPAHTKCVVTMSPTSTLLGSSMPTWPTCIPQSSSSATTDSQPAILTKISPSVPESFLTLQQRTTKQ